MIMPNRVALVIVLGCWICLLGCGRPQEAAPQDNTKMSKSQAEKLRGQIDELVAGNQHDTSKDFDRVRSVCTYCGAWKESVPTNILISLMEGAQPGSPEAKQISEAKKKEAPFFVRHLEQCGRKGGMIKAIYPDEPGWSKLDPKKREE
jgi:hypothetical protein